MTSIVHSEVSKLRDPEISDTLKLTLPNKFKALWQLTVEEDRPVENEKRQIERGYMETCDRVLGRAKTKRKESISKETWEIIEQRKEEGCE